jgi:hypothetical protein
MTDDTTPSSDSDISATVEDRPHTDTEKMGCNAIYYFSEKLDNQIHRVRLAWDDADKLRGNLYSTNSAGAEAEFLKFFQESENVERLAEELTRRVKRCTAMLWAFHTAVRRDRRIFAQREDLVTGAWESDVSEPSWNARWIDPRITGDGANELLSVEVGTREGEGEDELTSNSGSEAPESGGRLPPMTADDEAKASRIQEFLQQGIPLNEAFDMMRRQADGQ